MTDAVGCLLVGFVGPFGRTVHTQPGGRCALIGACRGAPSLSCPPRPTGACRHISRREDGHDHPDAMPPQGQVFAGVDTHADTHHAAAVDGLGRALGDREFPATPQGYRALLDWVRSWGVLGSVGVEGTGAYGTELARVLTAAGETVREVDRPDRSSRRAHGMTDPLDAYAAAQAVASAPARYPRHHRATGPLARHPHFSVPTTTPNRVTPLASSMPNRQLPSRRGPPGRANSTDRCINRGGTQP